MEFGIKIHLNLDPTNVHSPNYCTTKWAEDIEPQEAWLEGEPAKWDGSQRDGRDGIVSPFRNEAAGDTQSLCQGAQVLPEAPEPAPPTERQNIASHNTAQGIACNGTVSPLTHPKNQERREKLQGEGWPWMAACLTQETAFSLPSSIAHFIILVKNLD